MTADTRASAPADAPAGSDPFAARTPWSLRGAVAVTLLVVLFSMAASAAMQPITSWLGTALFSGEGQRATNAVILANIMLSMLVLQCAMIALVIAVAGRYGASRRTVLSLPAAFPARDFFLGMAAIAALTIPYSLLVYWLIPDAFAGNLRLFAEIAGSPVRWLGALVVVVGAPLSEELLFRGFLLPALAKGKRGFPAAALISTAAWTGLHFNYSLVGLIEVFAVGLLLCWVVRRSGNLWIAIALHALYNGLQFAVLAYWPRALGF